MKNKNNIYSNKRRGFFPIKEVHRPCYVFGVSNEKSFNCFNRSCPIAHVPSVSTTVTESSSLPADGKAPWPLPNTWTSRIKPVDSGSKTSTGLGSAILSVRPTRKALSGGSNPNISAPSCVWSPAVLRAWGYRSLNGRWRSSRNIFLRRSLFLLLPMNGSDASCILKKSRISGPKPGRYPLTWHLSQKKQNPPALRTLTQERPCHLLRRVRPPRNPPNPRRELDTTRTPRSAPRHLPPSFRDSAVPGFLRRPGRLPGRLGSLPQEEPGYLGSFQKASCRLSSSAPALRDHGQSFRPQTFGHYGLFQKTEHGINLDANLRVLAELDRSPVQRAQEIRLS